jgi:hypothetical protein
MENGKVREDPFYLWSTKLTVWVTHWSHLPCTHHSPNVKLLGVVKLRGQPKDLGKLSKLYVEPPTIYHPHRNPLFVVKEESRVELSDDILILIITELQKIGDAMEITSFNYSIERGILLPPHIVKMNPLHWDDMLGFSVEHNVIPILMKESLETLICAPFLRLGVASFLVQLHNFGGLNIVVVHHCLVGEDFCESHLKALKSSGVEGVAPRGGESSGEESSRRLLVIHLLTSCLG